MNPVLNKKSEIFVDSPKASQISYGIKILIGTPIHECKDYCMEEWLENVSKLEYPADLFLVDNSPGLEYVEKVKDYCKKYSIVNYKIMHLDLPLKQDKFERVARSREVIRKEIISSNYDAWFSWECDQIIPIDSLGRLIKMMKSGNFMMVNHNNWVRYQSEVINTDFGVSLVKRECLERYSFLLEFGTDPEMPANWRFGEAWFKMQVLKGGGSFIEAQGALSPVYHLDNGEDGKPLSEISWDQKD